MIAVASNSRIVSVCLSICLFDRLSVRLSQLFAIFPTSNLHETYTWHSSHEILVTCINFASKGQRLWSLGPFEIFVLSAILALSQFDGFAHDLTQIQPMRSRFVTHLFHVKAKGQRHACG